MKLKQNFESEPTSMIDHKTIRAVKIEFIRAHGFPIDHGCTDKKVDEWFYAICDSERFFQFEDAPVRIVKMVHDIGNSGIVLLTGFEHVEDIEDCWNYVMFKKKKAQG